VLICKQDRKWSRDVRQRLSDAGIRVVQTPARSPNTNAHAERFVRSIKAECLDRMVPVGERQRIIRPGGYGGIDIYVTTRTKLRGPQ
jgi:transposase InsO family protein